MIIKHTLSIITFILMFFLMIFFIPMKICYLLRLTYFAEKYENLLVMFYDAVINLNIESMEENR